MVVRYLHDGKTHGKEGVNHSFAVLGKKAFEYAGVKQVLSNYIPEGTMRGTAVLGKGKAFYDAIEKTYGVVKSLRDAALEVKDTKAYVMKKLAEDYRSEKPSGNGKKNSGKLSQDLEDNSFSYA